MNRKNKEDLFATGAKIGRFVFRAITPGVVNQMKVFGLDSLFDPEAQHPESERNSAFFALVYLLTAPLNEVVQALSEKTLREKALELELLMTEEEVMQAVRFIVDEMEKKKAAEFDIAQKPGQHHDPTPPKN